MADFVCETCGPELSSKHALESHTSRKYKCIPLGQVQHECKTCDKKFTRKNLLDQHLRTDKHNRAVAAAVALEGTGSTSVLTSASHNTSGVVVRSDHTTISVTNFHARPRYFGKADVGHLVYLTYDELRETLDRKSVV